MILMIFLTFLPLPLVVSCFCPSCPGCCARLPAAPGFFRIPCWVSSRTFAVHDTRAGGNPARDPETSQEQPGAARSNPEKAGKSKTQQKKQWTITKDQKSSEIIDIQAASGSARHRRTIAVQEAGADEEKARTKTTRRRLTRLGTEWQRNVYICAIAYRIRQQTYTVSSRLQPSPTPPPATPLPPDCDT